MRDGETLADVRRRAAQGNAFDQNQLGAFLATGDVFGHKDEVEARYWYLQAVRQGYIEAKWNLGTMLIAGEGGPKDVGKGMFLIEQAAAEQQYSACGFLADIHETGGYGIAPNAELSQRWREESERVMALNVTEIPEFGAPLPDFDLPE